MTYIKRESHMVADIWTEVIFYYIFRITIGEGAPKWYQYFLCGMKGIAEILPKDTKLQGLNVVVSGAIPQSAGLSSSSALVSAAALVTAHANNVSTLILLLVYSFNDRLFIKDNQI